MTGPRLDARRKGMRAESQVAAELRALGLPAERAQSGTSQRMGDIIGIPGLVIEVKDHTSLDLSGWLAQAERARAASQGHTAVVWHKRRAKSSPRDWYVTMDGATFMDILVALYGPNR